jgi:undecaprenyl-diphosphatase
MNDYLISLLLGIVEGLTEFLPISSTAHLRIVEALLHFDLHDSFWKMYTIVIQLGAILSLPVYFRTEIAKFVSTFPGGKDGDRTFLTHPLSLTLIAFVVTAIPAWLLRKQIGENLESLTVIAWAILIGGVVMWIVDALCTSPRTENMEKMNLIQAIWIGAAQILSAVFPRTSRSMSTIASGQIAGLSRPAALEFSFFVSMPTMAVATGYDLLKSIMPSRHDASAAAIAPLNIDAHGWVVLGIGLIVSFVVSLGVVACHALGQIRGFVPFAVYRIVLGLGLLVSIARGWFEAKQRAVVAGGGMCLAKSSTQTDEFRFSQVVRWAGFALILSAGGSGYADDVNPNRRRPYSFSAPSSGNALQFVMRLEAHFVSDNALVARVPPLCLKSANSKIGSL